MIHPIFQCSDASVVHIRRGQRDVSQRRRLEFPNIRRAFRVSAKAGIRRGIRERSGQVIELGIMKLHLGTLRSITEVETAMTSKTSRAAVIEKKQERSAFSGFRDSVRLA